MQERIPVYSWQVLILTALIGLAGLGASFTGIAPLFSEIAEDLNLDLVQMGTIWGMVPLATVAFAFPGGMLIDRLGVRRVLGAGYVLAAVLGGLRGASSNLVTLITFSLLFGLVYAITMAGIPKVVCLIFPAKRFGLAQGVIAASFTSGGALSVMASGILTSALGGWRNVLFLYSGILLVLSVIWIWLVRDIKLIETAKVCGGVAINSGVPMRESFSKVVREKQVWFVAIALLGMIGANFPVVGYLPLYFEKSGLSRAAAGGLGSLVLWGYAIGNLLLPVISDKLGVRKTVALPCALVGGLSIIAIPLLREGPVWLAVFSLGLFCGGIFPLLFIIPTEIKRVGAVYAGASVGLVTAIGQFGGFVSPILGGAMGEGNPNRPFYFWASLTILALVCFWLMQETGLRSVKKAEIEVKTAAINPG